MAGIAADRGNKRGDQVGAALQLDIDIGPAIVHHLTLGHEIIVEDDRGHNEQDQNADQDEKRSHDGSSSCKTRADYRLSRRLC